MKYYIDLFGCVKNQVDAENIMAYLNEAGWAPVKEPDEANLIIVNSCGFIESAKQESINAVLSWRKNFPEKKILLAGCLAQRYSKELAESLPEADGFFGVDNLTGIAEVAEELAEGAYRTIGRGTRGARRKPAEPKAEGDRRERRDVAEGAVRNLGERPLLSLPGSAYVKISEGCDNNCSYCAIPLIRGKLQSRHADDIVEECKILLGRGIKELCLVGQDTGSYGRDLSSGLLTELRAENLPFTNLPGLLEKLSLLEGDFWIRLLYIHPDHFPLGILDIMEKDRRVLPYFDIPFQHGSEKILKAMNRQGNTETYLKLIETIRERINDAVIRSTLMTGFPGETKDDFSALLDFQQKAKLDWLGCFAYSREENTPSYVMKGKVGKKLAAERKRLIEEKQIHITEKQMDRFIGRTFGVLVEEKFEAPNEDEPVFYLGRLPFQAPEIDGAAVIITDESLELGAIIPCKITARAGFDLKVEPVKF